MENYNSLLNYVADSLSHYEEEIAVALKHMDKYRCPLSSASDTIVDVIDDAIRDFCVDNDLDYYNFDIYEEFEKDIEDVFFDALVVMDY